MATRCCSLEILHESGRARQTQLTLPHGSVQTPAFMPVGTAGTVKSLSPDEVEGLGAEMLLANTYHLWIRLGHERVASLGGLHKMMGWRRPILTDSGGYQVFSLGPRHKEGSRVKLSEEGARFCSPFDGQWKFMSPEICVEIQETMGVDVAMALDECIAWPSSRDEVRRSTERTTRWLQRCLEARRRPDQTALFGIVQGGFEEDLRREHALTLRDMQLDGYAIGGVSVGEPREQMIAAVRMTTPHLPRDRPRYLMGVGYPIDIIEAVLEGVDLFDCVLPTRSARFGRAFTAQGQLNLRNSRFRDDPRPLDPACRCYTCRTFGRAYLRHLLQAKEMLGPRLVTLHNLHFYQDFMRRVREAISSGDEALQALRLEALRWQQPYSDEDTER